ncbi:alpha/beta-hydrolase [Phellopilus nigrolimitatus]|nr:alpha/beta-hydrolase [Phellopilus nigrolimitatus]
MPFLRISDSLMFHYLIPSCPNQEYPSLDPERPILLLLHPRLFSSYFFASQWRDARLARGYNLLAIDHHYHGKTKAVLDDEPYDFSMVAKDLLIALDELKVKSCHILGIGLGAAIAIRMYMLCPDLVETLILSGKHPPVETVENKHQYMYLRDACYEKDDEGNDRLTPDVVHGLHWIGFGDETGADAIIEEWVATSSFRPSNRELINKIFSSLIDREPISADKWATIVCPVLIIHGEKDALYPPSVAQELYDAMPNARREMHVVPEAPHFLSWTHALEVNDLTVKFLDRMTGVDSETLGKLPSAVHRTSAEKYSEGAMLTSDASQDTPTVIKNKDS